MTQVSGRARQTPWRSGVGRQSFAKTTAGNTLKLDRETSNHIDNARAKNSDEEGLLPDQAPQPATSRRSNPAGTGPGTSVPAGQAGRGRTAASWTSFRKLDIHLPEQSRHSSRLANTPEVPPPKPVPDAAVPGMQSQAPKVPAPQAGRAVLRMVLLPPRSHLNHLQLENLTA